MKTKFLFVLTLFLCASTAFGQSRSINGKVVSASNNETIIGCAVQIKGTTQGSVTDIDGNYTLNADANAVLVFSYMGFLTQEIAVQGRTTIDVSLVEDAKALEEVVVVGYGTMKKSDISGSVVSVDREAMMRKAPTNIAQGLQGSAPGVMVTAQDGAPDANAAIRIRGVATINGKADPLYVVDGVQVGTNANFINPADIESIEVLKDASATAIYGSAGANGVIMITTRHGEKGYSTINVSADFGLQTLASTLDVCSVDDYAANIRAARSNDGVGLWNKVWGEEYDGKRKAIDWQDQMTRAAWKQNYNISTSGGNEKSQFNLSLGFLRNDGVVVNSSYQRITARANVKTTINKYLAFGGDFNFVHTDSHGSNNAIGNFGNLSSLRDFAFMCPSMDYIARGTSFAPDGVYVSPNVVNPDGSYGEVLHGKEANDGFWGQTVGNMYAKQMELKARNRSNRVLASGFLEITPMKGLVWKTLVSYNYNSNSSNNFYGGRERYNYVNDVLTKVTWDADNRYDFSVSNNENQTIAIENYLTYNWSNKIHNVSVMAGNEVSRYYGQWSSATAKDFPSNLNRDVALTLDVTTKSGSGALNLESRAISYFGRLMYSFKDRYILTATLRKDGSSNFGSGNRWGTFPSAAAAWRLTEESFMKNQDIFSNLKIRLGWGQTGNSGGATDKSVAGLSTANAKYSYYGLGNGMGKFDGIGDALTGYYAPLVDENLKWETNEQTNLGIDLGLLNGELNITADYFIRTSKDLLLYRAFRPSTGVKTVYTNYGEIENKGIELSFNYNKRLNDDWSINATLTGSTLKNKVNKMGSPIYNTNSDSSGQGTGDGSNTGAVGADGGYHWGNHSICKEGEAVGSFYGYRVGGVIKDENTLTSVQNGVDGYGKQENAKLGDYYFKDLNGDGLINESDMDILGNGFPKLNYGITLGANYKNWDFSIYAYGVAGQKLYSYSAMRLTNMFASDDGCCPNILKSEADKAWSVSNPNGTNARLSIVDKNNNMRASDAWVKKANFLKINNIQVGYTFQKSFVKKLMIESARAYVSVQNVLTMSSYNKYGDPECGQGSVLYTGLDTGRYPMPRTYTAGISVQF